MKRAPLRRRRLQRRIKHALVRAVLRAAVFPRHVRPLHVDQTLLLCAIFRFFEGAWKVRRFSRRGDTKERATFARRRRREREKKSRRKKKNASRDFFSSRRRDGKKRPTAPKKERRFPLASCRLLASIAGSCLGRKRRPTCAWRVAPCEKLTDRRKATRAARAVRAAGASGRTRELGHVVAGHLLEPPSLRSSGCGAVGRRVSTGRSLGLVGRTHMAHERFDRRARAREPRSGYGAREAVPARAYETCDLPGEVPFA